MRSMYRISKVFGFKILDFLKVFLFSIGKSTMCRIYYFWRHLEANDMVFSYPTKNLFLNNKTENLNQINVKV